MRVCRCAQRQQTTTSFSVMQLQRGHAGDGDVGKQVINSHCRALTTSATTQQDRPPSFGRRTVGAVRGDFTVTIRTYFTIYKYTHETYTLQRARPLFTCVEYSHKNHRRNRHRERAHSQLAHSVRRGCGGASVRIASGCITKPANISHVRRRSRDEFRHTSCLVLCAMRCAR